MVKHLLSLILACLLSVSPAYAFDWPSFTAKSWLVADSEGNIIDSTNIDQVRSIASISKLMTVMVVLDADQKLNERVGPLGMFTREQLMEMTLVHSDNAAAKQLCEAYPGGTEFCIKAMNAKAQSLSMPNTKFVEASGLSVFNVSTARELIKLVMAASEYPKIVEASQLSEVKIQVKKRWFSFRNTNPIIGKKHKFIVSKTGYIKASGGCIVMMLDTELGQRIVVVLGSKNTKTRIPEAEFIAEKY